MSGSLNRVEIIGNVGKDPEIRHGQSGDVIVNLSVATSESWKDKATGEKRERTEWHKVVVFNEGLAGVVEKYVKKGSKIYVDGQLQTRKWTDKDGIERYSTEIVLQKFRGQIILLGGKESAAGDGARSGAPAAPQPKGAGPAKGAPDPDLDDSIPF